MRQEKSGSPGFGFKQRRLDEIGVKFFLNVVIRLSGQGSFMGS
jgi:hypothetical protein